MGSGYIMEHCVAAFRKEKRKEAFEIYLTDAVKCIGDTLANIHGGSHMRSRFAEFFEEKDKRTGNEIAADVIKRAGLKIGGDENGSNDPESASAL